jgi:hypothetical protein
MQAHAISKKVAVSAFIILCLTLVASINLSGGRATTLRSVGDFVGLGTHWNMYYGAYRSTFTIERRAEFGDGTSVMLPRTLSVEPDFWERNVSNFRFMKIQTNVALDGVVRKAYLDYLCRTTRIENRGLPASIRFRIEARAIEPPGSAKFLSDETKTIFEDVLQCRH